MTPLQERHTEIYTGRGGSPSDELAREHGTRGHSLLISPDVSKTDDVMPAGLDRGFQLALRRNADRDMFGRVELPSRPVLLQAQISCRSSDTSASTSPGP